MKKRGILAVNLAVLLFGLVGLFAKWIRLPAIAITFGRVLFSSLALGLYLLLRRQSFRVARPGDRLLLAAAGGILALHWWAFLQSIQLSSVAIGTITFSSFPLFVTFLEPLVFRQKLERRNVLIALLILLGVLITVPAFSLSNHVFSGILVGMLSALAYAALTLINKALAGRLSGTATAALVLLPSMLSVRARPSVPDLALLLGLGVITTALAHTLFISSLKALPARLAGVCSSLETVYGILFALLLLGEVPSLRELLGAAIILGAVIAAQLREA